MNRKELTSGLFRRHFPEWLNERYVEEVIKQTLKAFETRGAGAFYHSLDREAKQARWAKREAKIVERKTKSAKRPFVL